MNKLSLSLKPLGNAGAEFLIAELQNVELLELYGCRIKSDKTIRAIGEKLSTLNEPVSNRISFNSR